MTTPGPEPLDGITIVGAGRLGTALATALRAAGVRVTGPLRRGESYDVHDGVVLLCVPDAQIADAASRVGVHALVGHCSGATTLDLLAPHERFSLHPLLAVSSATTSFRGASCAVAGSTPRARAVAESIVACLGMHAFAVADEHRALYHAAASVASNYVVTLQWVAERLATSAGVAPAHLAPLTLRAAEDAATRGPRAALTGPIARGDEQTVERQRAAVAEHAADLLPLWDALADATRALART